MLLRSCWCSVSMFMFTLVVCDWHYVGIVLGDLLDIGRGHCGGCGVGECDDQCVSWCDCGVCNIVLLNIIVDVGWY